MADIDGDGHLDVVVADLGGYLKVYPGDGNGGFPAQNVVFQKSTTLRRLWAADLDGDGRPEILAGSDLNALRVFANRGDKLQAPMEYPTLNIAFGITVADLDLDGKSEVLVTNADRISVFPNIGGGKLGTRLDIAVGSKSPMDTAEDVAVADLDGDGGPDLAVESSLGQVTALFNLGGLRFGRPVDYWFTSDGRGMRIADVNRDGRPDLIAGGYTVAVGLNSCW